MCFIFFYWYFPNTVILEDSEIQPRFAATKIRREMGDMFREKNLCRLALRETELKGKLLNWFGNV